ncbi:hypothetical protein BH11MYX2_BH11MYX2_20670 [soil metagenome]
MPRPGSSLAVVTAVCATAVTLAGVGTARADPTADAAAVAKEASDLATASEYAQAAIKFRAAYAIDPRPEYLCNVGVAYQRAKDLPRASLYLNECLVRGTTLDANFVGLVKKALATAEDSMRAGEFAPLAITLVPETAAIALSGWDTDEKFIGSRVIWVPFGSQTLTVDADGFTGSTKPIDVHARIRQDIHVELVKPAATEPVRGSSSRTSSTMQQRSKVPAIVASVVTIGLGATAVVFYVSARSRIRDAGASDITREQYNDIIDDAHGKQHLSWIAGGAAGAGAIVSGYLWYRYASTPTTVDIATLPEGGATVGISGAW